jgi:putative nucleotidyltransferase with HDIG domain
MLYLKKKYIPSGNYYISKASPLILQAILGTCVGVAIYDSESGVGGLIHLLLAEPASQYSKANPERYASTGLPMFISALLDAGARKNKMKATVAGGALVGPVTEQDLNLDIGGNTAHVAKEILKQNQIYIENSETGGFFTCSLKLNLHEFQTIIEPAGFEQLTRQPDIPRPDAKTINQAIENLLPIPQVALKVMRIMDDETYDMASIAKEVRKDQVLTARTLKLCNSAFTARRTRIESIEDAMIYLGKNMFVQVILSAAIKNYFNQSGMGYSICKGGLYHHAVGTATIAEELAACTGKAKPAIAYIAGLMHDIGKVVLDQYMTLSYPYLYRNLFEKNISILDVEKETMGTDHAQVGYLLASRWDLPVSIANTIKHHHNPPPSDDWLTHIVYVADLLMTWFNSGLELERIETTGLVRAIENLGLSYPQLSSLVDLMPNHAINDGPESGVAFG